MVPHVYIEQTVKRMMSRLFAPKPGDGGIEGGGVRNFQIQEEGARSSVSGKKVTQPFIYMLKTFLTTALSHTVAPRSTRGSTTRLIFRKNCQLKRKTSWIFRGSVSFRDKTTVSLLMKTQVSTLLYDSWSRTLKRLSLAGVIWPFVSFLLFLASAGVVPNATGDTWSSPVPPWLLSGTQRPAPGFEEHKNMKAYKEVGGCRRQ